MLIRLIIKFLGLTAFDPLTKNYPRLPNGKYGLFICDYCKMKTASRWNEKTGLKLCFNCAIKG